jgi:hypothetical protein
MSSKPTYGLLNDSILGHLLCVYLKLSLSANDKYYFVINQTDQLITSNPNFLEKLGICEIKRTFGTELHKQIDQEKQTIKHYNQMSVTALASGSPNFYDVHRKKIAIFEKILRKYKIYETPVIYADFEKKDTDSKIHDCLAYVISFDKKQYDKLSKFIKSYNSLFLTRN